jgi:hypothetical protein
MSKLIVGTQAINMDEPCLELREENRLGQRHQVIITIRNGKPVELDKMLGPEKGFGAEQFRIPGGGKDETTGRYWVEHTVGELVDMAEYLRDNPFPFEELPHDGMGLIQGYYDTQEQKSNRNRGRILVSRS